MAWLCLMAVLVLVCVQTVHAHPGLRDVSRGLDSHCSLCLVSHATVRPQHGLVVNRPGQVHSGVAALRQTRSSQASLLQLYVRPPPAA